MITKKDFICLKKEEKKKKKRRKEKKIEEEKVLGSLSYFHFSSQNYKLFSLSHFLVSQQLPLLIYNCRKYLLIKAYNIYKETIKEKMMRICEERKTSR